MPGAGERATAPRPGRIRERVRASEPSPRRGWVRRSSRPALRRTRPARRVGRSASAMRTGSGPSPTERPCRRMGGPARPASPAPLPPVHRPWRPAAGWSVPRPPGRTSAPGWAAAPVRIDPAWEAVWPTASGMRWRPGRARTGRRKEAARLRQEPARPAADTTGFERFDAGQQCAGRDVALGSGQPHQRHLERDARIGGLAHLEECLTDRLEGTGEPGGTQLLAHAGRLGHLGLGEAVGRTTHADQERVAQSGQDVGADDARVVSPTERIGHRGQRLAQIAFAQGFEHTRRRSIATRDAAGGDDLIEGGEGVAGRAAALPQDVVDRVVAHVEPGVVDDVAQQRARSVRRGAVRARSAGCGCGWWAAPSAGRWWPARTRRGRAAPRASSAARSTPPAESMWTSSRMYTLVRPGEPSATLAMRSRISSTLLLEAASSSWRSNEVPCSMARHESHSPHGSPSVEVLAVERLGQDPGGGGLARAAGPAEQVGVADPVLAHGVVQRATTWSWPRISREALGPIAAVEGLVGHRGEPTGAPPPPDPESAGPGRGSSRFRK